MNLLQYNAEFEPCVCLKSVDSTALSHRYSDQEHLHGYSLPVFISGGGPGPEGRNCFLGPTSSS
jgi:hypothetical protein